MNSLFEIGQKVVCVDSAYPRHVTPLVEGKVYTVNGITRCSCGTIDLDIGTPNPSETNQLLCKCGAIVFSNNWTHWQGRFVPLEFDRQAEEAIHEALKGQKILN